MEDTKLVRLSQKDFGALQQAILQLYEYRDFEIFRQAVPAIFLKLIPAEAFWWPEYHVDVAAKQVASWVAKGKTNPEIGIILQGSIRTVEKHMERILEKLGVENRVAAALLIAGAASQSLNAFAPDQSPPHHLTHLTI